MKISFSALNIPSSGAIVTGVKEGGALTASAKDLDKLTAGALKRAIAASRFTGGKGQTLEILAPAGVKNSRVLLVGLGKGLDELAQQSLGGAICAHMNKVGEKAAHLLLDAGATDLANAAAQVGLARS